MRYGVVGAQGQLGSHLLQMLDAEAVGWNHSQANLTDVASLRAVLSDAAVNVVINCAAYNQVDHAESEPATAYDVNALGPRNLALLCEELRLPLVHISTDYVFGLDGQRKQPLCEDDPPGPISAYGLSKLAGEYFVRSICTRHFVIRTCGLYGHAARRGAGKGNFVETMLRLGHEREELRVVDDQHCTPTSVADLAEVLIRLTATEAYGLYHVTNSGETTWAQLAQTIFQLAGLSTRVVPIPTAEYPTKARRPAYSVLDCSRVMAVLGKPIPSWESALERYLAEREEPLAD
ncbi:MAG: dTDP-4-dehydrorhamnose reductase [Planctomycetaceae bacterium]|nr:dTDP-4-dehydrorhamnose reductase [Planctomycetaceae bacterium]